MQRAFALLSVCAVLSCSKGEETPLPATPWKPGVSFTTPREATVRGFIDRRGLIHAHSVYSHDACDGQPQIDGVPNEECFNDFRRDICKSKHDFVFLTDHRDLFGSTPFPDTLLYRADRGDRLVERGGKPVASWAACADGMTPQLIMAGTESRFLGVGIEEHPADQDTAYGQVSAEAVGLLKEKGALSIFQHLEDWTIDQLATLPIDGFEMFNLHRNTIVGLGGAGKIIDGLVGAPDDLPESDLSLLFFVSEDPLYLSTWGTVLARGVERVTTMGTDCHRNTFPQIMPDGERIDSYRRMMMWFSNHLLVKPEADGSWDDRHLKEALKARRNYGAFEVLGYPLGFDYRADAAGAVTEMGGEVALSTAPTLTLVKPTIRDLDASRTAPAIQTRILKAKEGGWDVVASGEGDLTFKPTEPGAYRGEVRMVPHHLREDMRIWADELLAHDYVWIYANAIYVK